MVAPTVPLLFAVMLLAVYVMAVFPPSVSRPVLDMGSESSSIQDQSLRVMFNANVLEPFVTVDGGTKHVVAVQRYNATGQNNPFLRKIYPSLDSVPRIGLGLVVDPEEVLLREPSVVISWGGRDAYLREIGVPGLVEIPRLSSSHVENHLALWSLFGELTGKQQHAEALVSRYQIRRDAIRQAIAESHEGSTPGILLLVGGWVYGYWIAPPRHLLNERFETVGARVLHKRGVGGGANLERILELDPDILFLDSSGTGDLLLPADLYARPEWHAVRAVREQRVYKMPWLPGFSIPVEDPIRLQWLAEILYPKLPIRTREEVKETFFSAYGYTIDEDDIDRMLFLSENFGSHGYERFARSQTP